MRSRCKMLLILMLGISQAGWAVEEPVVKMEFVGTDHLSSFSPILWIHVTNTSFTPLNLVDRVTSSQLIIDGKPSTRLETASFSGPPGLPAVGSWTGCFLIDDYAPPITPGKHKVLLKMGGASSDEATIHWEAPVNWRKGTMETRMKEVRDLASHIKKGLPRSCVEQWLTVRDGGVEDTGQVRYFLEPQIKVIVPYGRAGELGGQEEAVNGPLQVYQEAHFKD